MVKKCPKGKILRKAYTRKDGTKVKAVCVLDKGMLGRTPKSKRVLPKLEKDFIDNYRIKDNYEKRKKVLLKAMKEKGSLSVLKYLVVLRTYNKRNPYYFNKLDKDVKYIQKERIKRKKRKKKVRFKL